jgi:predicted aspartyl protease
MMHGIVGRNCEATIRLVVGNTNSQRQTIDALVDTGFTGFLTLPLSIITRINLRLYRQEAGTLGDSSTQLRKRRQWYSQISYFCLFRFWFLWFRKRKLVGC